MIWTLFQVDRFYYVSQGARIKLDHYSVKAGVFCNTRYGLLMHTISMHNISNVFMVKELYSDHSVGLCVPQSKIDYTMLVFWVVVTKKSASIVREVPSKRNKARKVNKTNMFTKRNETKHCIYYPATMRQIKQIIFIFTAKSNNIKYDI